MEKQPADPKLLAQREGEIRQKRIASLLGAYALMCQKYPALEKGTFLNPGVVARTVEHYLADRRALCGRNNITGRIQRHKIAGLMAGAIVKNKPIMVNTTRTEIGQENETLAVYHGLAICAEGQSQGLASFMGLAMFRQWVSDTVHLFGRQPGHTESFIGIFEAISLTYFPDNLKTED